MIYDKKKYVYIDQILNCYFIIYFYIIDNFILIVYVTMQYYKIKYNRNIEIYSSYKPEFVMDYRVKYY